MSTMTNDREAPGPIYVLINQHGRLMEDRSFSDKAEAEHMAEAYTDFEERFEAVAVVPAHAAAPLTGKYRDVLAPFLVMMEHELHANAGKGDRPGWLAMDRKTALLEIFYHLSKLQKAAKDDNHAGIREYAADVANMAMMLVDVCGALTNSTEATPV